MTNEDNKPEKSFLEKRRDFVNAGRPTAPKKPYKGLNKVSPKRQAKLDAEKEERGENDTEMQTWYKSRQKQLTGKCLRCGVPYNKKDLRYAIAATAHVLGKRDTQFPSVKYHNENFIELSATCGCHNWYDNFASWEEIALSPIWPVILEKFKIMEPQIEERGRIPEVFLQEIKPKI